MAMLCKKLSFRSAHRDASSSSSHFHLLLAVSGIVPFSTAAAVTGAQNPPPKPPPFILQYLIDSCGFSPDGAARASRHIPSIKSPSNPDSVIRFLKDTGLDGAQIRDAIAKRPSLLRAKVEPTLKAKRRALLELGFSESELPRLIHLCPHALTIRDAKPKIEFWRDFYPTNEALFKAMKKSPYILSSSIERIVPNLSLLRSCGLSDTKIAKVMSNAPWILTRKHDSVEEIIRRADELGIPRGSGMFGYALSCVSCISPTTINSKIRLLETFGISKAVIMSKPQSMVHLFSVSEKKITNNMGFLIKKAGCDPSYVIFRPSLVRLSLERRLIPRFCVLRTLKSKGLAGGGGDLYYAMCISENKFLDKFVLPHKDKFPEILETYFASCSAKAES